MVVVPEGVSVSFCFGKKKGEGFGPLVSAEDSNGMYASADTKHGYHWAESMVETINGPHWRLS
jgi:hypothetical protein